MLSKTANLEKYFTSIQGPIMSSNKTILISLSKNFSQPISKNAHCVQSISVECHNKYFLVWTSTSVNKSIVQHIVALTVHSLLSVKSQN